jgi:hypothetical protein
VQPSLIPELAPTPPRVLILELPEARLAEAVALLADLIAKAAAPAPGEEVGDE